MEPLFPLGDWRWGLIALACVTPGLIGYRREVWAWCAGILADPIRYELREFRQDPGRGDLAATLIETAPNFQQAERIFNTCRRSANPRAIALLNAAMIKRLHTEEPTPDVLSFLEGEGIERIPEDADDGEREYNFEWMIAEFEVMRKTERREEP